MAAESLFSKIKIFDRSGLPHIFSRHISFPQKLENNEFPVKNFLQHSDLTPAINDTSITVVNRMPEVHFIGTMDTVCGSLSEMVSVTWSIIPGLSFSLHFIDNHSYPTRKLRLVSPERFVSIQSHSQDI